MGMRTPPAKAIDLKKMGNHLSLQSIFNLFDDLLLSTEFKVLHLPTRYANKVVVMAPVVTIIVVELAVGMDDFINDTALGQLLKITVDSGETNFRELPLHPAPYFFRGQVNKLIGQDIQDSQPLRCYLKTHAPQGFRTIQPYSSGK